VHLARLNAVSAALALLLSGAACRQREEAPKAAPAPTAPAPTPVTAAKAPAPAAAPEMAPAVPPVVAPASAPETVERGRYLVEAVLACGACHTDRDYSRYGGPARGEPLAGACFGPEWDLPGRVCAPNLTSDPEHGLGRWTDAELLRALREGYGRDGRTLFPMMPYPEWRALSDADARAVVAYLRQVSPVARSVPRSDIPKEVQEELKGLASPLPGPVPAPGDDDVARGRYLATIAQCAFCHAGDGDPPQPFAGGRPSATPYGEEKVPSLLPHGPVLRGLGEDAFVARFAAYRELAPAPSHKGRVNKLAMPWGFFAGLHEADLRAVYRYLQTLPPPPPTARKGG
jgi:mono/diheme cytochrome c family protein